MLVLALVLSAAVAGGLPAPPPGDDTTATSPRLPPDPARPPATPLFHGAIAFDGFHAHSVRVAEANPNRLTLAFWLYVPRATEFHRRYARQHSREPEAVETRFRTVFRRPSNESFLIPAVWLHPDTARVRFSLNGYHVVDRDYVTDSARVLDEGSWNHLALVVHGNIMQLQINGTIDSEYSAPVLHGEVVPNTNPFYFGWEPFSRRGLVGILAEAAHWPAALDEAAVRQHMDATRPRPLLPPAPVSGGGASPDALRSGLVALFGHPAAPVDVLVGVSVEGAAADTAVAHERLAAAAAAGDPKALFYLGVLAEASLDAPRAEEFYQLAAASGSAPANMALAAYRYLGLWGSARDCPVAAMYYAAAAGSGRSLDGGLGAFSDEELGEMSGQSQHRMPPRDQDVFRYGAFADYMDHASEIRLGPDLDVPDDTDDEELVFLMVHADNGDALAQAGAAQYLHEAGEVAEARAMLDRILNNEAARDLAQMAPSKARYARILMESEVDLGRAEALLHEVLEQHKHPVAAVYLGDLHFDADPGRARSFYEQAVALAGDNKMNPWITKALARLGVLAERDRDLGQAIHWYAACANAGDRFCALRTGTHLLETRDPSLCDSAVTFLKRAAELSERSELSQWLSRGFALYLMGEFEGAFRSYLVGGATGSELGRRNAAWLVDSGLVAAPARGVVPAYLGAAVKEWHNADEWAFTRFADLVYPDDRELAYETYRRAASLPRGSGHAMFNLALMHVRGHAPGTGGERDAETAKSICLGAMERHVEALWPCGMLLAELYVVDPFLSAFFGGTAEQGGEDEL